MSFFNLVVLAAMFATVIALVSGICSMVVDGDVGHLNSGQWMVRRVAFQATAFALVLVGLYLAA